MTVTMTVIEIRIVIEGVIISVFQCTSTFYSYTIFYLKQISSLIFFCCLIILIILILIHSCIIIISVMSFPKQTSEIQVCIID